MVSVFLFTLLFYFFEVVLCESDLSLCRVVVFACDGGLVVY